MSSVPSFTGPGEAPPTLSAFPLVDSLAGMSAVQAALMAVYERDVIGSGKGQVVDISLYESIFRLLDSQVVAYDQLGIVKRRQGNRMDEDAPRNTYQTADGQYSRSQLGPSGHSRGWPRRWASHRWGTIRGSRPMSSGA